MKRALLLGCGASRERRLRAPGDPEGNSWDGYELVTLDKFKCHNPDIHLDIDSYRWGAWPTNSGFSEHWPIEESSFDRVDAYDVLEHLGCLGHEESFFRDFYEIWRILKPGGILGAICPRHDSIGTFGDPGHKRIINEMSLIFLDQTNYVNIGKTTMTDYRDIWKGDFKTQFQQTDNDRFGFVLEAIKPARVL